MNSSLEKFIATRQPLPPSPHERENVLTSLAADGEVTSAGVNVHWYEYGPAEAEVTIVFVHGFTLAAESFVHQTEFLRDAYPEVKLLLVDLRGHGRSDHVPAHECTIALAAQDVLAVMEQRATGAVVFVGHSLGSSVVMEAVAQASEETYRRIVGIVIAAASIEEIAEEGLAQLLTTNTASHLMHFLHDRPSSALRLRERISRLVAPVMDALFFMRTTDPEEISFHARLFNETPSATIVGFYDDVRHHTELDAVPRLSTIPGYVIAGEHDVVVPVVQSERIVEVWEGSWLQVAQRCGHMIPLEAPGIMNAAIQRVLERHRQGR